jgi:hypothetical protein
MHKFIVVASDGGGHQLLRFLLNNQKAIYCGGLVGGDLKRLNLTFACWFNSMPSDFLAGGLIFDCEKGGNNKDDFKNFADYLINNNIKIIHLTLDELFLKFLNVHRAFKIKKGFDIPCKFDVGDYNRFVFNSHTNNGAIFDICHNYKIPYHGVVYEDLISDKRVDCMKGVFDFLDLDFADFVDVEDSDISADLLNPVYNASELMSNYEDFGITAKRFHYEPILKYFL